MWLVPLPGEYGAIFVTRTGQHHLTGFRAGASPPTMGRGRGWGPTR